MNIKFPEREPEIIECLDPKALIAHPEVNSAPRGHAPPGQLSLLLSWSLYSAVSISKSASMILLGFISI